MKKEYLSPVIDIIVFEKDIDCDIFGSSEYGDTLINYEDLFGEEN